VIDSCLPCQAATHTKQDKPLKMTELPEGPWHHLRADLFGPIPTQEYVLVVQCLYSRYPTVEIVNSTLAAAVIPAIDRALTDFGIPFKMGTDNGPPFSGHQFANFERKLGFNTPRSHHRQMARLNTLCDTLVKFSKLPMWRIGSGEQSYWRFSKLTEPRYTQPLTHLLFNGRKYNTKLLDTETEALLTREA